MPEEHIEEHRHLETLSNAFLNLIYLKTKFFQVRNFRGAIYLIYLFYFILFYSTSKGRGAFSFHWFH